MQVLVSQAKCDISLGAELYVGITLGLDYLGVSPITSLNNGHGTWVTIDYPQSSLLEIDGVVRDDSSECRQEGVANGIGAAV